MLLLKTIAVVQLEHEKYFKAYFSEHLIIINLLTVFIVVVYSNEN